MIRSTYRMPKGKINKQFEDFLDKKNIKYRTRVDIEDRNFMLYDLNNVDACVDRYANNLVKDFKATIHDESAEEIIDLINKSADEGRTYTYLYKRIPEFFDLSQRKSGTKVFPTSIDNREVYLEKPKKYLEVYKDYFTKHAPEILKVIKEINDIVDKYNIPLVDRYTNIVNELCDIAKTTDSKSEELKINKDAEHLDDLIITLDDLLYDRRVEGVWSKKTHNELDNFYRVDSYDFIKRYPKNTKELLDLVEELTSKDNNGNERFNQNRRGSVVSFGERNKVRHLSPMQETYIRRIVGSGDTKDFEKKRLERLETSDYRVENGPWDHLDEEGERYYRKFWEKTNAPDISLTKDYRIKLTNLLKDLKSVSNEDLDWSARNNLSAILKGLSSAYTSKTKTDALRDLNKAINYVNSLNTYSKQAEDIKERIDNLLKDYKKEISEVRKPLNLPDRKFKK